MKLFCFVLAVSSMNAFGQCTWNAPILEDSTCSPWVACGSTLGCASVNFSVNCDSCYCIDAKLLCEGSDGCKYCQFCVDIYSGSQSLGNEHRQDCLSDDCDDSSCDFAGQVFLETGKTYTLYACLTSCEGYDCEDCNESCKVHATVSYATGCP